MRLFTLLFALAGLTVLTGGPLQAQSDGQRALRLFPPQLRGGSYLGISLNDIDADRAKALKLDQERGVEVTEVIDGSPAEAAGIKAGDVLLTYNGENILGAEQFVRLVQETPKGRKIRIQFWRDGKMQTTMVTTGAPRPQWFNLPSGQMNFQTPELQSLQRSLQQRALQMPDIPNPVLMWKSTVLGIECEPVDSQLAQYFGVKQGVLVRSVEKGSAADKAGLKAGDVITSIGDRTVATPRDLTSYIRMQDQPGRAISLALMREHKELTLTVSPSNNQE